MGSAYRHDHDLRLRVVRPRTTVPLGVAVLCALVVAANPAPAAAPSLSTKLNRALKGPYLPPGRTAAIAVDLQTGTVLFAHNDTKSVIPASNEKLPLAWAALVELGPAYRFHTELYGIGARRGSAWDGDLVLKGFGDPTLTTADLAALAHKVRSLGITNVNGRIRGDESFYDR